MSTANGRLILKVWAAVLVVDLLLFVGGAWLGIHFLKKVW